MGGEVAEGRPRGIGGVTGSSPITGVLRAVVGAVGGVPLEEVELAGAGVGRGRAGGRKGVPFDLRHSTRATGSERGPKYGRTRACDVRVKRGRVQAVLESGDRQ